MNLKGIKEIGILGVGFMGGSLALALKERFKDVRVTGWARSQKSFRNLIKFKGLDEAQKDYRKVCRRADILILALPVGVITDYLKKIGPYLKKGAIVFDLGSTKEEIVKTAGKFLPKSAYFVGCHPFCGSEKKGASHTNRDIYKKSLCFITSGTKASFLVERIWKKLGSKTVRLSPGVHDKITCYISHLPHAVCFSLVESMPDRYLNFISPGFRDLTRIASSPENLWADIFLSNREKMLDSLDKYMKILSAFGDSIKKKDRNKLKKLIKAANKKRSKII